MRHPSRSLQLLTQLHNHILGHNPLLGSQPGASGDTLCYRGSSTHSLIEPHGAVGVLFCVTIFTLLYNLTTLGYWQQGMGMGMGIAWIWILAWI